MKTIIAGSRGIEDYSILKDAIENSGFLITEVVSGTAKGVDRLGEIWATQNRVHIKRFPAEWDKYGKRAGFLRNEEMARYADALIAIWDVESRGTLHMINIARDKGLKVSVFILQSE